MSRSVSVLKEGITCLACLQVSLRMSKELPLVVQYRIVDMGEIKWVSFGLKFLFFDIQMLKILINLSMGAGSCLAFYKR